jgi:hypothetical protein
VNDSVADASDPAGVAIDYDAVTRALRAELARRGHQTARDTTGMHRALYLVGANDVARALFEFKPSADDAMYDLMSQGAWVAGMPPRFAVLPGCEAHSPALETLVQIKAFPLLFDADGARVTFRDLDRLLGEHLGTE